MSKISFFDLGDLCSCPQKYSFKCFHYNKKPFHINYKGSTRFWSGFMYFIIIICSSFNNMVKAKGILYKLQRLNCGALNFMELVMVKQGCSLNEMKKECILVLLSSIIHMLTIHVFFFFLYPSISSFHLFHHK